MNNEVKRIETKKHYRNSIIHHLPTAWDIHYDKNVFRLES